MQPVRDRAAARTRRVDELVHLVEGLAIAGHAVGVPGELEFPLLESARGQLLPLLFIRGLVHGLKRAPEKEGISLLDGDLPDLFQAVLVTGLAEEVDGVREPARLEEFLALAAEILGLGVLGVQQLLLFLVVGQLLPAHISLLPAGIVHGQWARHKVGQLTDASAGDVGYSPQRGKEPCHPGPGCIQAIRRHSGGEPAGS